MLDIFANYKLTKQPRGFLEPFIYGKINAHGRSRRLCFTRNTRDVSNVSNLGLKSDDEAPYQASQ